MQPTPTPQNVVIRPYEARDRAAVRHICCETADRGEPVESFFSDRELVADLVTRYYTDFEPETSWVAERDGRVVGYLTGALDTARHERVMARRILAPAIFGALRRGALWRRETWRMISVLPQALRGFAHRRHIPLGDYPAHLHIDLLGEGRGQHIGHRLMAVFLERLRTAGARGTHASVRGDNASACAFFEHLAFRRAGEYSTVLFHQGRKTHVPVVIYARPVEPAGAPR